jgi:predicted RNA-binding protein with RPS1 domain
LKPGQESKVQIITVDPMERKIGLSIKGANRATEMADAQGYAPGTTGGATLGDVMRAKLAGAGEASDNKKKKGGKAGKKARPADDGDWEAE